MAEFRLIQIPWHEMLTKLLQGPLYGIPTEVSFDDSGRCYVWPIPYRLRRD